MLPLSKFLDFIKSNKLFDPAERILLAVSGGKDSVLMAALFNEAGFGFGIAHCNFDLRGEESDGDEKFAEALAKQYNIPFYTTRFDTASVASSNNISIQMAARDLRYNWFEQLRSENGYDYVSVAHHQNDVVETVLLNLVRGTGIAGLHGILPKRGKLVRPLLFLTREEIDQLIADNEIPYREDGSNISTKYARNKIRHDVVPQLKALNPLLEQTFETNAKRFKELEDFLNSQVELLRSEIFKTEQSGIITISVADLRNLHPQALLLFELFKPYNFSEAVLKDLAASFEKQSGKLFLSPTHQLLLDRAMLILETRDNKSTVETLIYNLQDEVVWPGFKFRCFEISADAIEISINSNRAFFDADLLQFPLKLRHWKKGDFFHPFGMKGKKKLSDFFTGLKIPVSQKNDIPIMENGNGDIIWVAGYRTDERYKITSLTKKVIIFEKYNIDEH